MYKFLNVWSRKLHRWGAVITAIPLLIVIATGLLLQVKKQVTWVQPPTLKGTIDYPLVDWTRILEACQAEPRAAISSWHDVERLDIRPDRGLIKVQARNHWELQLDLRDGNVLSSLYRRSDWIESLHDGSFFSEPVKLGIFLPSGVILFGLWATGCYLWYLPYLARGRKKRKVTADLKSKEGTGGGPSHS